MRANWALWRPALSARGIATRVLAEHLAQRYPDCKALVFGNPYTRFPGQSPEVYAFERKEILGLKAGFRSSDKIKVVYPELRPEAVQRRESIFVDPKTTTPLSFLIEEDAFDRLAQANSNCTMLVSLIGLPANLSQNKVWRAEQLRFGLLLPDWRMIGDREAIRQAVKSEKVAAAVINRPGSPAEDEPVAKDYHTEFDRRFVLVTRDNIDQLLRSYPQLF